MNQQQLQIARAALWHQTAPLQTGDEATAWLEDLGLCLFLPRHAQLPAPAPSFVEAVHGAASAAPPAGALERASGLTARLVEERRVLPLNLLGTYSEQPDFLITPEILPWVAAIRGDRQWNAAPGGRAAPLVVRTWQVLDREGEATAVQLRELLGRELTEGAVLRALIELWTTVRAMPVARTGEPTRWTLMKNRFPAQMATGANTAQTIAISALLSIYLRSAVAATAEEAEVFLSPLTARSRIREVIHGMSAARQLGTMSVGSQTLLFVAGSLPENLPVEEEKPEAAAAPRAHAPTERAQRAPRPPFRKEFQDKRRSSRPSSEGRQQPRPPFQKRRPEERGGAKPWQRRPGLGRPDRPVGEEQPSASRPGAPGEKRPQTGFPQRPHKEMGPRSGFRKEVRGERRSASPRPWNRGEKRLGPGRWQKRDESGPGKPREDGRRSVRKTVEQRTSSENEQRQRPRFGQKFGSKPGQSFGQRSGAKFGPRLGQKGGPKGAFRPSGPKKFGAKKPGATPFAGPRPKFPPRREESGAATGRVAGRDSRTRFGKPRAGEDAKRRFAPGKKFKAPGKENFRKDNPQERNPRKNRNQEEKPE